MSSLPIGYGGQTYKRSTICATVLAGHCSFTLIHDYSKPPLDIVAKWPERTLHVNPTHEL